MNFWGINLRAYTDSIVDEVFDLDCYRVRPWARLYDVGVLDLGANVGAFSLLCRQAGCKVLAVEPEPITFQNLLKNLEINPLLRADGITATQAAVAETAGVCSLFRTRRPHNEGVHGDHDIFGDSNVFGNPPGSDPSNVTCLSVPAWTFQDAVEAFNYNVRGVDFCLLKVDIEGGEKFIFKREHAALLRQFAVIVVEIHSPELLTQTRNCLQELDYETRLLSTSWGSVLHAINPCVDSNFKTIVKRGWN